MHEARSGAITLGAHCSFDKNGEPYYHAQSGSRWNPDAQTTGWPDGEEISMAGSFSSLCSSSASSIGYYPHTWFIVEWGNPGPNVNG
jgi:hypothetical protein